MITAGLRCFWASRNDIETSVAPTITLKELVSCMKDSADSVDS